MDLMNEKPVDGTWNSWRDLSAYCLDAPVMVPRGSCIQVGSKPGRFVQDTCVTRPGEELPDLCTET